MSGAGDMQEVAELDRARGNGRAAAAAARFRSQSWAGLLIAILAVGAAFTIATPYFLNAGNFANLSRAVGFTGVVAAVTTIVLISGGVDLSIASMMALAGVTLGLMIEASVPWPVALVGALAVGAAGGAFNGLIVTRTGINALIATVATGFMYRGLAFVTTGSFPVPVRESAITWLGTGSVGIPVPAVLMFMVFVWVAFLLNRTRFGLHVQAIGGSPGGSMARLAGVPVIRRKMQIYVASGIVSALGGVLLVGYTSLGDPGAAFGQELPIIGAVIVGGTSLGGGRGSVFGTFLGVVLIGAILNGLTLVGVSADWQYVVQGLVLLLAVLLDEYRSRKERTEAGI
ncbi:MAG: ABC transporter permease [Chloroflexota bacterium]